MKSLFPISDSYTVVEKNEELFLCDRLDNHQRIVSLGELKNGLRPFSIKGKNDCILWGCIDSDNHLVVPCRYESLSINEKGQIFVVYPYIKPYHLYGRYYLSGASQSSFEIDYLGNPLIRQKYNDEEIISTFWGITAIGSLIGKSLDEDDCDYVVCRRDQKEGLAKKDGTILIEPLFDFVGVSIHADGILGYISNSKEKFFDVLSWSYGEGLIAVQMRNPKNNEKDFYFINRKGEIILRIDEDWRHKYYHKLVHKKMTVHEGFNNGLAILVETDYSISCSFYYKINKTGEIVDTFCEEFGPEPLPRSEILNYDGYDLYEAGSLDEDELLYRDAFEDDPGAEWNTD